MGVWGDGGCINYCIFTFRFLQWLLLDCQFYLSLDLKSRLTVNSKLKFCSIVPNFIFNSCILDVCIYGYFIWLVSNENYKFLQVSQMPYDGLWFRQKYRKSLVRSFLLCSFIPYPQNGTTINWTSSTSNNLRWPFSYKL